MERFLFYRKTCDGFTRKLWLLALLLLWGWGANAQCPTGNVSLTSQAEVDAFGLNYPNCTQTSGHLLIGAPGGTDIVNLDGLSNLTQIGGDLYIQSNYQLTNLDGLSNLTQIGGALYIQTNSLTNLDGLSALESINGDLGIYNNPVLTDISGLQNIDPATILPTNGLGLYILNNPLLSVCNLDNFCTYLQGSGPRTISFNAGDCISVAAVNAACLCDAPTALTATATSVGATLNWSGAGTYVIEWGPQGFTQGTGTTVTNISTNSYSLTDLDYNTQYQFYVRCQSEPNQWAGPFVFTTLPQCPTGDVMLYSQAAVDAFAVNYPNCTQISGHLLIGALGGTDIVNLEGLSNVTSVGDFLLIGSNHALTTLDGLNNLTSVGGYLSIGSNNVLTTLDGLSNLTSVGGNLLIGYTSLITTLDGLSNLESINGTLEISINDTLTDISGLENIDPSTISGLTIINNANLSVCNIANFCTYLSNPDNPRAISGNAANCISEAAVNAACTPACETPTNLSISNVTSVSATLNWSGAGTYVIEWGPQGFTQGSGTTVTGITANSYNLTNLDYNTQYQFYVRQDCTVNESDWAGPFSFTTLLQCPEVVLLLSQAEVDAFATNYPNCTQFWTLTISGSDITDLSPLSNITILYDELYINDNPVLTNLNGLDNLTSVVGLNIISNPSLIDISGLQNINPATIIPSYGMYITNNPQLSICNLPNFCEYLAGSGDRYIAGNAGDCISEAAVTAACTPACDAPTNLTVSGIINNKATINWTNSGTFDLKWGAENFTDGNELGTANGVTALNYEIIGLTANTAYDVYVRQNCDVNQSDWAGPFSFTTLLQCPTGDIEFFSQADVDAFALAYPNCGHIEGDLYISGNTISDLSSLVNLETVEGSLIVNNTQLTSLEGFNNLESVGNYLSIFENPFLTNLNDLNGLTSVYNLQIYNNNALTDISGLQNLDSNVLGGDYGLYIINNINLSVCNLPNFCAYLSNPNKPRTISGNAGECLNELAVMVECLPCDTPESLSVQNITSASAKLNWSGTGDYVIEWGEQGFTQGSGTTVTDISDSFYELTNLNSSTSYQFYVRCKLQPNNWVGPVSFYTPLQCPIANDNIGGYSLTTQAAVDAFAVNYPNCTNIPMSLSIQTGNIELTSTDITNLDGLSHVISIQGQLQILSNGNLVDIDGLSNLTNIGGKLYIYYNGLTNLDALSNLESINGAVEIRSNASLTDISGLENIDPSTISGLTIINNANLSVCNIANFCTYLSNPDNPRTISGNAANCISVAAVNVACAPACEAPTNLTATNMTINSAILSWTSDGSLFDIEWGIEGFTQGSGAVVNNITTTTYTLSGVLSPDTTYEFYVLKNCTVNQSDWVGPFTFMTLPLPTCATPTDLAVTDITTSSATLNWESDGASFEVVWVSPGFNPEAATPITNITTTSYTISEGLDANTQYDFYVRQNCTEDEIVSDWVGPYEFTTSAILCPVGDVSLNTQVDVDAFLVQYPNCTHIDGTLQIGGVGSTINNLDGFSNIESIAGALLVLNNWDLENLDGLSSLITVIGHLQITNNFTLTDIDGLSNLTSLGADITIAYNDNLASVSGLSGLTTINPLFNDGLRLFENESLTTCEIELFCDYLSQDSETHPREIYDNGTNCNDEAEIYAACNPPVACSEGDIYISSQQDLNLYVANYPLCTIINGSLFIEESDISDLSGLNNIETIIGDLYISDNQQLTTLNGLSSLETIGGGLFIWVNDNLQDVDGLYSLRTIEGMLSIDSNPLQNLNGLNALESIGDELMIAYTELSNLDGLSNLTHLGADISIMYNDYLEDISGLSGLTTLIPLYEFGLQIFNNPLLSTCNLNVFCNYLSNDPETHPRYIVDNAGNCNSEESIIANCGPLCTAPTNLSATNITTDSATLSWTSDGNLFDIEWGAQGFTQGSGTEVNNVGTTTYNLSGLVANTTYDFYVRQNCTINQSTWVGPFTFITLEEEWSPFSSVTLSGFNHDVIADGSQIPSQTTTTAIDGDTSSTNYVLLNGTYNYNGANPTAYLPSNGYFISAQTPDLPYQLAPANQNNSLRLESGQSGALTFATPTAAKSVYVLATSGGGSSQINVTVHFDDNTTQEFTNYTILDWYSGSANYAIQGIGRVQRNGNDLTAVTIRLFEKQFVLSVANQAKNIVSVSFQRTGGGGGIANVMGISIENSIIPTCMAPANLTASDITAEGLTISWGAVNNVNNYQWVLVANGADPNTSSPVSSGNTAQNEVTLSGLEQSTLYDFYVKSDCGVANGTSLWAGPFNFKVGYYNEDIPTQYNEDPTITSTDFCMPEPTITVVVPNGMQIAGLQVVYKMTALNGAWMSEQRSFIYSPTLALGESTLAEGSEDSDGTMTYNRSMDFANGATGTVEFTLRAWRTWGGSGCSTYNNKVDSGTWAIIPTFEPFTACAASTTWIGTSWSNGEPTITTKAIIDGALTLTSDLTACELEVTENGSLTIPTNRTFTIKGQVVNHSSSDDFVIKSDGILIQIEDVENQGAITVERASTPMYRLDYTIWSSPVSGMLLRDFSDVSISGGSGTLWNRVYTLGDNAWDQVWASQQAFESDYTSTFAKAKGYMYRAKNTWVTRNSGNPAESDLGVFTGVPNNGTISINTPLMFNAIGNPYPSPIDGNDLLGAGATGLYFWTNTNTPEANGTYLSNNWAYYNQTGGTGVQIGDVGVPILVPDGIIQPGQGFVAGTTEDVNQITFNNEMRMSTNGSFFRQMSNERHRFWLNLSDEMAVYNQILVGYMENATQDVDAGIDAEMFAYEGNAIYSIIDNNEEKFVIQGRSLPFTDADVVKLGFRAIESGSFSISLNNFDGIFEQENLIVYLKDNFNQTQHNLKNGAYSFVSEEGFFENRFEVVYQTTMSTDNPNSTDANWIVYRQDKGFQVQTIGFEMKEVEVYDILGRAVYTSKAEGTTHHIPVLGAEGVFIVKVTTTEDKVLNKKVR